MIITILEVLAVILLAPIAAFALLLTGLFLKIVWEIVKEGF